MDVPSWSPRGAETTEDTVDVWEGVPLEAQPVPAPRAPKPRPELVGASYRQLLGRNFHLDDGAIQVLYKMEVPTGKAETFLAAFWKHEASLQAYSSGVSIARALVDAPVPATATADAAEEPGGCRACLREGRAEPCEEYAPGALRRVKDFERQRANSEAEEGTTSSSPPRPTASAGSVPSSPGTPVLATHVSRSASAGPGGPVVSPQKKKSVAAARTAGGAWRKRRAHKFVERRCRTCQHLPHDHAAEGSAVVTFTLSLDFKTRAAWMSAYPSIDDVVSEPMRDCIARFYEPTVCKVIDELNVGPSAFEYAGSSMDDEELSAATESLTSERGGGEDDDLLKQARFFRFSLWKAQNLPTRADGTPHTWVVQAKFGKSILSSSPKRSNDPSWKEHFHFKWKEGRLLYLRILATDDPGVHQGRVKVRVSESASRSRSSSAHAGRLSFQDDRRASEASVRGFVEERVGSLPTLGGSWGRRTPVLAAEDAHVSEENSADKLWESARQWRVIKPVDNKLQPHGQMLVSLQVGVQLPDPLGESGLLVLGALLHLRIASATLCGAR